MEHFERMRTHAHVAAPPSFLTPAAAWFALAAVAAAIGIGVGAPLRETLVMPISFAFFGVLAAVNRYRTRQVQKKRADDWIAKGHVDANAWYGWRIAQLTSTRERRLLARSVRHVIADAAPGRLPGAVPLNRVGVRPQVGLLGALADRLEEREPVDPRGILEVRTLLAGPNSPLYEQSSPVPADSVASAVCAALERLEVH